MSTTTPGTGARIRRLVWILLVFVVVGPPIGALAFMLALAFVGMGYRVDLGGLTWVALFAVIYGIPFGYLIGIGPAAAAGLIVGIRQAFFGRMAWWLALATGLVVGAGFQFATGQSLVSTEQSVGSREQSAIMIVTCMAATFACWAIMRRRYYSATAGAGP